jgi:hypothetical protein
MLFWGFDNDMLSKKIIKKVICELLKKNWETKIENLEESNLKFFRT